MVSVHTEGQTMWQDGKTNYRRCQTCSFTTASFTGTNSKTYKKYLTHSKSSSLKDIVNSHLASLLKAPVHLASPFCLVTPTHEALGDKPHPGHSRDLMTKPASNSNSDPTSKERAMKALIRETEHLNTD